MHQTVSTPIGDKNLIIETGKLAKQADGAVTVQYGETVVIVTVVAETTFKEELDFFPLTVDYREKAAAAGKFPGGYFKREGRPTEKEILTSRMIDRPCRPLFPEGFYNDTQIMAILLSADTENDPDILAINGASAALTISDIPWHGPIGAVRVGRVNGQFVVNPTHTQRKESDLDLIYVGNDKELVMIEGTAKEIAEADIMNAIEFAHGHVQKIVAAMRELAQKVGVQKRNAVLKTVRPEVLAAAKDNDRPGNSQRDSDSPETRTRSRRRHTQRQNDRRPSRRNFPTSPTSRSMSRCIASRAKPFARRF